jgi:hypothetical protein
MRLRRVFGMGAAAVCCLLASACLPFGFGGGAADKTIYHRVPEDVPEEQWIRDDPSVPVRFEGVFVWTGEDEPTRDEAASMSYSRLLRKARVFAAVRGPDVAAPPEPLAAGGRARLEIVYLEDAKHAENLVKAALVPAGTGYRIDLTSTMRLSVVLPEGGDPIVYQATSVLTRVYYHANHHDAAKRVLVDDADHTNFLAIIHQLRADPRLYRVDELEPL